MAEDGEDGDRDDRDQEQQECVLNHRLPFLAIARRSECEIRPRRKRAKHVHYSPPSGLRRRRLRPSWQSTRSARFSAARAATSVGTRTLDRSGGFEVLRLEGWVLPP